MLTCQQFFYDGGQSPRVLERLQTAALRSSTCAGERRTEPHSRLKFSRWNPTGGEAERQRVLRHQAGGGGARRPERGRQAGPGWAPRPGGGATIFHQHRATDATDAPPTGVWGLLHRAADRMDVAPETRQPSSDPRARQLVKVRGVRRRVGADHLGAHRVRPQGAVPLQALPQLPAPPAAPGGGGGGRVHGLLGDGEIPEPPDVHLQAGARAERGGGGGGGRVL
ncbi:translation initiation factor IF-2-like isoform X2 [Pseudoliparis swirei]|uniref:translation initiation factor IF-2-like isoform X2 n=1 Tax=Pseudoliparis swirei TaxID=2059687 RepID=UPI0024BD9BCD|nr:translation initiation factor IF-2-like isoform X2 [Pseudoliparis swirei]